MPVQFECPHCSSLVDQTKKNREMPRIDVRQVRPAVPHAVGTPRRRSGSCRAVRSSANDLKWPATSATSSGTPPGSSC